MNKTRLEAFSDGVLAIIITIMVLEIKVPHGAEWSSLQELIPLTISYVISFLFVGIYWGNHHHLLHTIKKVSSGILWQICICCFGFRLCPLQQDGWERIILRQTRLCSMLPFACSVESRTPFCKK